MLYDYKCTNEDCEHVMEDVQQSIHDKPKKKCPKCGKNTLERIIYGGIGFTISKDPTTIGQLADKNYKDNKSRIDEINAKKEEEKPKEDVPFYHKYGNATRTEINKMTPQQKKNYILKGKK